MADLNMVRHSQPSLGVLPAGQYIPRHTRHLQDIWPAASVDPCRRPCHSLGDMVATVQEETQH